MINIYSKQAALAFQNIRIRIYELQTEINCSGEIQKEVQTPTEYSLA